MLFIFLSFFLSVLLPGERHAPCLARWWKIVVGKVRQGRLLLSWWVVGGVGCGFVDHALRLSAVVPKG
jgi:hypothetical protein